MEECSIVRACERSVVLCELMASVVLWELSESVLSGKLIASIVL